MNKVVNLTCDLGEGYGVYTIADDAALINIVSSVNIACGFHAGDPRTMARAVELAVQHNVKIGAHPGFPDLNGFGRRDMKLSAWEITTDVLYQLGALDAFVKAYGGVLHHVTPHGRLGNLADLDAFHAKAVLEAIGRFDSTLRITSQEGELTRLAKEKGFPVSILVLGDRAYHDTGIVVNRREPGAVIHDADVVVKRSLRMVIDGTVESIEGNSIPKTGDTLLVHGDTAGALELAKKLKQALIKAGVTIGCPA